MRGGEPGEKNGKKQGNAPGKKGVVCNPIPSRTWERHSTNRKGEGKVALWGKKVLLFFETGGREKRRAGTEKEGHLQGTSFKKGRGKLLTRFKYPLVSEGGEKGENVRK